MTNKQSEAYMKKFEKIMENKMKVINKYNINLEVYLRVSNVKIQSKSYTNTWDYFSSS